ncbi:MAG: flagellin [Pseudomonadota bacterium]
MTSVNTNYGALVALQSLNQTTKQLGEVQNHVNTGLKVASAKDNGAVFAIAEGQRARVASLGAVQDGIDRATSVIDTGLSAGEAIGDILKQLKEKAVAAQATDLSQDQRDALQADFSALRGQIDQIANAATFNGSNLVNGSNLTGGANAFSVLTSDASGSGTSAATFTGATTDQGDGIRASSATFDDATESNFAPANGGGVRFSFTDTAGNKQSYYAAVDSTTTIQQFVDSVSTATDGKVTATYDDTTGKVTYSSTTAFTADFLDDITDDTSANGTDNGILSGTLAAAGGGGGTNSVSVDGFDFRLGSAGQALATVTGTLDISSAAGGSAASTAIDTAITELNKNLATLGAQSKALDVQKSFLGKLSDTITAGIGNLVDADLAKESAQLQALQVKQQLGAQALSIANQAPSIVLSFFR